MALVIVKSSNTKVCKFYQTHNYFDKNGILINHLSCRLSKPDYYVHKILLPIVI